MPNFFKNIFTKNKKLNTDELIVKKTIISFFFFFVLMGAAFYGWKWLRKQPDSANGTRQPLRNVLDLNESVFRKILSNRHLTKEYAIEDAVKNVRVNGDIGLKSKFDTAAWRLYVIKDSGDTLTLTMNDIKKLPKTEIVFDFKCIEGWSQITHWAGVKFTDFAKAYGLTKGTQMQYVGMDTPDKKYYVGIDMQSMLHPQTILCYEMNGNPLPLNQGYPLRLIIPVKYGIKHLKRIGTIFFSNSRPPDYWFERGYDYYSGL